MALLYVYFLKCACFIHTPCICACILQLVEHQPWHRFRGSASPVYQGFYGKMTLCICLRKWQVRTRYNTREHIWGTTLYTRVDVRSYILVHVYMEMFLNGVYAHARRPLALTCSKLCSCFATVCCRLVYRSCLCHCDSPTGLTQGRWTLTDVYFQNNVLYTQQRICGIIYVVAQLYLSRLYSFYAYTTWKLRTLACSQYVNEFNARVGWGFMNEVRNKQGRNGKWSVYILPVSLLHVCIV